MPERELREHLEQLQQRLADNPQLDPEARRQLSDLAREIETVLGEGPREAPSLIDRLRAATERFEESHPDLTAVTGRIADLLARMGI